MASKSRLPERIYKPRCQSLGFAVSKYGYNQLAYRLAVQCSEKPREVILFYENLGRSWLAPQFALLNIGELYDFNGPVVATNPSTASFLIRSPGPTKRFFYLWDLDWMYTMEDMSGIYQNPNLRLIARSEDHRKIIEDAWARSVTAVVEDCCLEDFYDLIESE